MNKDIDVSKLANEALNGKVEKLEKGLRMIYDPETGNPIGMAGFKKTQKETLGYMSLSEKVTKILTGEMDFHADDRELEFDEDEGSWDDEEPDLDPTNDLLDKTDVFDIQKDLLDKQRELQKKASATKVEPGNEPVASSGTSEAGANEKTKESNNN